VPVGANTSAFLYAGYPGEPALAPKHSCTAFSGMDIRKRRWAIHWLDATHVTFGVVDGGLRLPRMEAGGLGLQRTGTGSEPLGLGRIRLNSNRCGLL